MIYNQSFLIHTNYLLKLSFLFCFITRNIEKFRGYGIQLQNSQDKDLTDPQDYSSMKGPHPREMNECSPTFYPQKCMNVPPIFIPRNA